MILPSMTVLATMMRPELVVLALKMLMISVVNIKTRIGIIIVGVVIRGNVTYVGDASFAYFKGILQGQTPP